MISTDVLRKAASAIYLATEESVADDISTILKDSATALDRTRKELESLREDVKPRCDSCYLFARTSHFKFCPYCGVAIHASVKDKNS